ncbi:MAG: glycine dehydrogenase, partial [Phenylobacterium sp.]
VNHGRARTLARALAGVPGIEVLTPRFFNEVAVRVRGSAAALVEDLAGEGILAGVPFSRLDLAAGLDDVLLLAATETTTPGDIDALVAALSRRTA